MASKGECMVSIDPTKYQILKLLAFDASGEKSDVEGIVDAAIDTYLNWGCISDRLKFLLGDESPYDDMDDPEEGA